MRRLKPTRSPSPAWRVLKRPIVLVGLMGAGKSSIGRLLATRLDIEFIDADTEIENAAHASIEEIFKIHGEAAFRSGERRVIARLLAGPVRVVATGGGAFIDTETRRQIKALAHSVWLKADLETLLKRVSRRGGRPLLKDRDPHTVMTDLISARYPLYAKADVTVETSDNPPAEVADQVIKALERHLGVGPLTAPRQPNARVRAKTGKSGGQPPAGPDTAGRKPGRPRRSRRGQNGGGNRRPAKSQPRDSG